MKLNIKHTETKISFEICPSNRYKNYPVVNKCDSNGYKNNYKTASF